MPQTPKQVHFASEKAHLESVVVFTKGTRPRSLSNPGGNDTETETEGYDSSSGGPSWARANRYPFPAMPKDQDVPQLDETRSTEVPFKSAVGGNGYLPNGERQWVVLETVNLPGTRPPILRGSGEYYYSLLRPGFGRPSSVVIWSGERFGCIPPMYRGPSHPASRPSTHPTDETGLPPSPSLPRPHLVPPPRASLALMTCSVPSDLIHDAHR